MTTYNTGNPIGSTAVKDLYDNTENLDVLTNTQDVRSHPDRLGVERITWHGMEQRFIDLLASSGYEYIGDYAAGVEVTEYNQVIRDTSGEFWRVSGKTSLPYTTTGAGLPEGGAFVAVGDAALRQELANPDKGALMVRGAVIYVNTIADLQTLDTSELVDGQQAVALGAVFRWNATNSAWIPQTPVLVEAFGAAGDGTTDDIQAFKSGIQMLVDSGGGTLLCSPGKTYAVSSPSRPNIDLGEGVTLDLNGSTIQRIAGSNTSVPIVETRLNIGRCAIKNGSILGTGSDGNTTDQGSAVLFLDVADALCENITIDQTDGDGIQGRRSGVTMRNVTVKRYGRNGISPTSGNYVYDNVVIEGPAYEGANPGIGLDAENNTAGELGVHKFYWIDAPDMTFVDFHRAAGEDFGHEVDFIAGRIRGIGARHLRFRATNALVARHVHIGPGVTIERSSEAAAVHMQSVSGVKMNGTTLRKSNTSLSSNVNGIELSGSISGFYANGLLFEPDEDGSKFNSEFASLNASDDISNIRIENCGHLTRVYARNWTDSVISGGSVGLTLNGAGNSGITLTSDCEVRSVTLMEGASLDAIIHGSHKGSYSRAWRSVQKNLSVGSADIFVPFPETTLGAGATIFAHITHRGRNDHYAYKQLLVNYGSSTAATAAQEIASFSAGSCSIVVSSITREGITFTVDVGSLSGDFTATVVG